MSTGLKSLGELKVKAVRTLLVFPKDIIMIEHTQRFCTSINLTSCGNDHINSCVKFCTAVAKLAHRIGFHKKECL